MSEMKIGLEKLREPFPENLISKLPKPTKSQTDEVRADFKKGIRCVVCGGWHHPQVIHLDYVGHAALTHRLLDADPNWTWEPVAIGQDGLPVIDDGGGLWIRLTVCGVTRLGYGDAQGKVGGDAMKERIGDALRNAAMRFGAALDLWHKGDLHAASETLDGGEPVPEKKIQLPRLTDDEARIAYAKWEAQKLELLGEDGMIDNEMVVNAWGKLPSNVRSAIKRYGENMATQKELESQAKSHLRAI